MYFCSFSKMVTVLLDSFLTDELDAVKCTRTDVKCLHVRSASVRVTEQNGEGHSFRHVLVF